MINKLEISWESEPTPVPVLQLHGRLDAEGAQQLREAALASLKNDGEPNLVVDLGGVEFVASTGLATFLLLTEEFADVPGKVVFVNAAPAVVQVISLLNISQFLQLAPTADAAFTLIGAGAVAGSKS
jgi:anti-sigma B factor antagonist